MASKSCAIQADAAQRRMVGNERSTGNIFNGYNGLWLSVWKLSRIRASLELICRFYTECLIDRPFAGHLISGLPPNPSKSPGDEDVVRRASGDELGNSSLAMHQVALAT